jgi:hypothetical protein
MSGLFRDEDDGECTCCVGGHSPPTRHSAICAVMRLRRHALVFRLPRRARLTHRFCACARLPDDEPAPEPPKQERLQAKEPKAKKVKAKSGGVFDDDEDESSEDDGTSFFATSAPQSVAKGASFSPPTSHMPTPLCNLSTVNSNISHISPAFCRREFECRALANQPLM